MRIPEKILSVTISKMMKQILTGSFQRSERKFIKMLRAKYLENLLEHHDTQSAFKKHIKISYHKYLESSRTNCDGKHLQFFQKTWKSEKLPKQDKIFIAAIL